MKQANIRRSLINSVAFFRKPSRHNLSKYSDPLSTFYTYLHLFPHQYPWKENQPGSKDRAVGTTKGFLIKVQSFKGLCN